MCGICGIFAHSNIDTLIRRMVHSLKHRGPDDSGAYVSEEDNISLGHTRLRIIDLSDAGQQPMSNEDETIWIVYNGETYNFPELRAQLERKGHRFRSDTDTEVVIHLYEDYGEACVHKLNGMFAFAIWDESQGKLLLVRDRLGIKPLYYCYRNGQFAFSSEIKAILESGIPAYTGINWQAMYDYFSFLYVPHPQTIFEGIYQLPPACLLTFSPKDGKVNISKYWSMETIMARKSEERVDYVDSRIRLRELLTDSVNMRLIGDVPLGVFLSGGIDSTILTGLMAEVSSICLDLVG